MKVGKGEVEMGEQNILLELYSYYLIVHILMDKIGQVNIVMVEKAIFSVN